MFEPHRLHRSIGLYLRDHETKIHVSAVSLWEIAIKVGLNKLEIPGLKMDRLLDTIRGLEMNLIELSPDEAASSIKLSSTLHKDPFDRMIAWQAISRDLLLVTSDDVMGEFEEFGLRRFKSDDTTFLLNEEIEAYNAMIDD
jgi:PIN domain nuclease of toxin-antitoxin system